MALLQPVYDRFTEGFDTTDHKAAKPFSTHSGSLIPAWCRRQSI
jgi:hypothetical protein